MQSSQQQTQDPLPRSPTRSPHRKKQSIASPRVKKASVYNVKRMKSLQSSINNGQHFDSDFPKETVYPSIQAARDGINKWATTRNGTFSVILGKSYKSQMPSGESGTTRVDILCSRSGVCKGRGEGKRSTFTKKCNCPWRLCVVLLEGEEPFETVWMPLNIQTYLVICLLCPLHGNTLDLNTSSPFIQIFIKIYTNRIVARRDNGAFIFEDMK